MKLSETEGGRNSGGAYYRRFGGYVGQLPPTPLLMVPGLKDVDHGTVREVGEVPDGLHPGYR